VTATDTVELTVDGDLVATKAVRVEPGESTEVVFQRTFTEPGDHEVTVESVWVGTLTVEPLRTATDRPTGTPTEPSADATDGSSRVEVVDASSVHTWVRVGFEAAVQVTVRNPGESTATRELTVTVDGDPVTTRTVTLEPGDRRELTIKFEATPGQVAVEGVDAGRLRVGTAAARQDVVGGTPTSEAGPGFGAGTAALALVFAVAAAVAVRNRAARQ
jgi:uncharacterized cupredoxin-like copper-binding protein